MNGHVGFGKSRHNLVQDAGAFCGVDRIGFFEIYPAIGQQDHVGASGSRGRQIPGDGVQGRSDVRAQGNRVDFLRAGAGIGAPRIGGWPMWNQHVDPAPKGPDPCGGVLRQQANQQVDRRNPQVVRIVALHAA